MKKIISIYGIMGSLLIAMLPGVSSCDKLEDELFKKNTYTGLNTKCGMNEM